MKLNTLTFQPRLPNDEPLRPSIQASICFADTTGTPCACADCTTRSEPALGQKSKCMFAVNTP